MEKFTNIFIFSYCFLHKKKVDLTFIVFFQTSTKVSAEFSAEATRYEKEVDKTQRAIAKVEDNLDETISTHKNTQGRLGIMAERSFSDHFMV